MPRSPAPRAIRKFGIFELDESAGELRRTGTLVHLPPQPFQILKLLLEHPGEVVDRTRIQQEVWNGTTVDFDRSLNVAIAQIRSVLNDDAASPRFVQTVPRRGYRFLAEVGGAPEIPPPTANRARWPVAIAATLGLLAAALLSAGVLRHWAAPAPIRIAVLPFEKLSLDSAEAVWADGLFDDLIGGLGGVQPQRLAVIGRRSVNHLTSSASVRDLGKQLSVSYILESTVRRDGESLRLAARLVDTGSQAIRWSATFTKDGAPSDFEEIVVGRVSAGVLTSLFPTATPAAPAALCRDGGDAFDTGRMLIHRGGLRDLQSSLAFFQKAACPAAAAETADVQVRLARAGNAPANWEPARQAAQSAMAAGGNLALAHLALGNVAFWHDWDWPAAQHEFREALRINPSNPDAHHDLAWLQAALGMRGDSLASLDTALALDPLSARTRMDAAWLLLQLGQFQRAASEARRALALDPGLHEARFCISRALLYAGDVGSALAVLEPLLPPSAVSQTASLAPAAATRRLVEFQAAAKSDAYQRAWALAFLGSTAEALAALEQAFTEKSPMMPMLAADPAFRALRADPRFRSLLSRMKL